MQVTSNPVSAELHSRRMQNVAGTMAIEGVTLSEASRRNLDRYARGQVNYQQVRAEAEISEGKVNFLIEFW
ncbi:MAG: hypothetical protein PUB89_01135 [Oscillospiraceae bacterium]|nr:hypothetical protein [Oscillospiraceae bacterium]